jgi:hypothetical protein
MLDTMTILNVLEKNTHSIESQLGSRWGEFSHRVEILADRFKAIADEHNPEAAAGNLEVAVNDLLEICWDYPEITFLLDQAEEVSEEIGSDSEGTMQPSVPILPDLMKIKEIANRYHNLLTKLKEIFQAKG